MTFLAPFYLVLAAAAGVPLLMHLMRRQAGARVDFPAARYLQRAEREHSRSLRLRNALLMLLRVLLVLTLAIAAARPFVRGVGVGHGPSAIAIVLDNSMSTTAVAGGTPTFTQLRDAVEALLRNVNPGDRLWLVTADARVRGGDRAQLLAELHRIAPLESNGDLPLALRRAEAAVQGAALPTQRIALATDGQLSAFRNAPRLKTPVAVLVPRGDAPANRSVVSANAAPLRFMPSGSIVAEVNARDSVGYRVMIGERIVARGIAESGTPIVVHAAATERGWQSGRVEIDSDDFPADDRRWFAVWVGAAPSVTADASAGPFVATALAALVADRRATTGRGVRVSSADAAASLPALIVPPADPVRLGAANRALARLGVPWRYGAVDRRPAIARGARLDGVAISERYALRREGAALSDTIATAAGEPWIVGGPGYVLVSSRLDPSATTLPVRAQFVPWLVEMLSLRLGGAPDEMSAPLLASPGDVVRLPEGADALESADGVRRASSTNAPDERGVWFILRRGRRIGALVVNAPPEESLLERLDARRLATRLGGANARPSVTAADWVRGIFLSASSRPALVPLLIFALLLFAAEAVVVRNTRGVRAARSSRSIAA